MAPHNIVQSNIQEFDVPICTLDIYQSTYGKMPCLTLPITHVVIVKIEPMSASVDLTT